ncbi:hypothetical protein [Lewinella sp. LCG006]|uniref:hypothetical protein n=1 Tax=Lewinella sp. LCG006 TaxID=3231911 RepID=UPI00345F6016
MDMLDESGTNQLSTSIALQVVFGSPSRGCAGSGVCKMLPHTVILPKDWLCPVWAAHLYWYAFSNTFQLSFPLAQFTQSDRNKWFAEDKFLLEEAFTLPLWLAKLLGENNYSIPAGSYPCETHSKLTINFKIAKQKNSLTRTRQRLLRGA